MRRVVGTCAVLIGVGLASACGGGDTGGGGFDTGPGGTPGVDASVKQAACTQVTQLTAQRQYLTETMNDLPIEYNTSEVDRLNGTTSSQIRFDLMRQIQALDQVIWAQQEVCND